MGIKFIQIAIALVFIVAYAVYSHAAPINKPYAESYEKPLIIMYWASYCRYCKDEIPILVKLSHDRDVYVKGVPIDRGANKSAVEELIGRYRGIIDLGANYKPPSRVYGVPAIFIIKEGKVVKRFNRSTSPGEIERYL